jgi:hypothetical protein
MKINKAKWLLLLLLTVSIASLRAGLPLESVGTRFGFPANDAPDFLQAEAFADFNLPWRINLTTNWFVQPRLDVAAGWLGEKGADALIASAGPSAILGRRHFPLTLDLGSSPTVMSRDEFPGRDFGIPFQFTTHLGVDWQVCRHFSVGYRFQHMSNAHIATPNPGLNLNMFTASYDF